MSSLSDVIELYLYDLDVTDQQFRAFVLEAIEKDMEQLHGVDIARRFRVAADLHSVRV